MKKVKSKPVKDIKNKIESESKKFNSEMQNAKDYTYAIFENGNCFELHKNQRGTDIIEKVFIQANTNYKDFKEASNKYRV